MKRIIVLGAGLSGLSLSYHLQRRKINCQVFEREEKVGGLASSKQISGFHFDYAGHLLHFKSREIFSFVKGLLGDRLVKYERNASIYSFYRFIPYPFQVNLFALPHKIKEECLNGFIEANKRKKFSINNFQEWVIRKFGKGIAIYFMFPYNYKFWTIPLENLAFSWIDGLIPVPSFKDVIRGANGKINKNFGYNTFFWYPKRGINELPLTLAKEIKNIFTHCEIKGIDLKKRRIKLANGSCEKFDYLFSSIPLPELPNLIGNMPQEILSLYKKLCWNSIFNINLGIHRKIRIPYHWIYFPEEKFSFYRVGFYHNFSLTLLPPNKSSIYIEISYSRFKPINKKEIVSLAIKDLIKAGIIKKEDKNLVKDINDIKYGYPIYDFNYPEARKKILNYLRENNVVSFGRYGSWCYMSMEDVIKQAKEIAMAFR